jgi:uncharacterized protein
MSIHKQILEDAKQAMLKKNELCSLVLKGVKAAFINEIIAKNDPKKTELTDDEAIAIIRRLVKQRTDSIEQFTKGNRKDLADVEAKESKILEVYLPAMMSDKDVRKIVEKKKKELGISDKSKAGLLMSATMKELKGKADGATVKREVDKLFE